MTAINETIDQSTDDAYDTGTSVSTDGTVVQMGYLDGYSSTGGYRFTFGTAIPADAVIDSLVIDLDLIGFAGSPSLGVYLEHSAAPVTFGSSPNWPSERTKTTAYVTFSPTGTGMYHVNLKSQIEEVLAAHGALSAIAVIVADFSGSGTNYVQTRSYDYGSQIATLTGSYTTGGAGGWLRYRHI